MKIRLAAVAVALWWLAASVAHAQDQLERLRDRIDSADRRAVLAEKDLGDRLIRIETSFDTLNGLLKGVGGAVAIQLVLKGVDIFFAIRQNAHRKTPPSPSEAE